MAYVVGATAALVAGLVAAFLPGISAGNAAPPLPPHVEAPERDLR
ncbi:hypothetical protein [Azospirillum endophyticum]